MIPPLDLWPVWLVWLASVTCVGGLVVCAAAWAYLVFILYEWRGE